MHSTAHTPPPTSLTSSHALDGKCTTIEPAPVTHVSVRTRNSGPASSMPPQLRPHHSLRSNLKADSMPSQPGSLDSLPPSSLPSETSVPVRISRNERQTELIATAKLERKSVTVSTLSADMRPIAVIGPVNPANQWAIYLVVDKAKEAGRSVKVKRSRFVSCKFTYLDSVFGFRLDRGKNVEQLNCSSLLYICIKY